MIRTILICVGGAVVMAAVDTLLGISFEGMILQAICHKLGYMLWGGLIYGCFWRRKGI